MALSAFVFDMILIIKLHSIFNY